MSQAQYESQADRDAEQMFSERMTFQSGARLKKLKKNYIIDFVVLRGKKCVAYIEYKRRWVHSTKYKTIILATSKWIELCRLSRINRAFFYIQYDDRVRYIEVTPDHYNLSQFGIHEELSGRTDRGDEHDLEPCVHIPTSLLS